MRSYLRSQWYSLIFSLISLVICIYIVCTTNTTFDGTADSLYQVVKEVFSCIGWFLTFVYWVQLSRINYNQECIEALNTRIRELEKRTEELENHAITDLFEAGPNHFVAMRRCGPDKERKN